MTCAPVTVSTVWAQEPPVAGQAASVDDQLSEAEKLVAGVDFEAAATLLERIGQRRNLSREQMIRVTRNLAVAHAVLGHDAIARETFIKLLALEPDFKIDPNMSPRVQAPYFEARGFWTAQTVKPGIELAATLHRNIDSRILLTFRDPTRLATKVVVGYRWEGHDSYSIKSGPPTSQSISVPPPRQPNSSRLEVYARAVDANDSVLFESGTPEGPGSVMLPPVAPWEGRPPPEAERRKSVFASPVFWVIAGVVVAGGAAATYFATREPQTLPPTSQGLRPVLACGGLPCQ
jgi:hypothetical protein